MFIEILFKMLLFKGGVLIYAEHCIFPSEVANLTMRKMLRRLRMTITIFQMLCNEIS